MSSLRRHLPEAALLGAFVTVLGIVVANGDLRAVPASQASHAPSAASAIDDSIARSRLDSANRAQPGYVIDSILPMEEELRRFRAVAGPRVTTLSNAAPSLRELVERFARAVRQNDTLALTRLAMTPSEFAWLVYPTSPYTHPPFRQAPGLVWMSIHKPGDAALHRLLDRFGGRPFDVAGVRCDRPAELQGDNRLHPGCLIALRQQNGAITRTRLFGTIVERAGTFKLVSFANDL